MKLTSGEKLILVMLSELHKHLEVESEINPDLVLDSIFKDQTWGLSWEYNALSSGDKDQPKEVEETTDILNMYRRIAASLRELPNGERERVKVAVEPFSSYLEFQGFDGNEDAHFGIATFLMEKLGRYDELKDGPMNSHSSTLPHYKEMLQILEKHDPHPRYELPAEALIEVVRGGL